MPKIQITCKCPAYDFPHRQGSGDCKMPDWCNLEEDYFCYAGEDNICPFVDECPVMERIRQSYHPRPSETLSAAERNPNLK